MKKLYFVCAFVCVWILSGCGGGSQPLTVAVTAAGATVQAGGTVQVTATVANDPGNKGVAWTVACSAAQCGSVSPTTTSSGAATTYTAPSTPPASDLTVTITATSASDSTKLGTTTIKVLAITVSVAPGTATVASGSTAPFTATVANDSGNKGVTWTVTCSAAPCGAVSPASTATGVATTYTAPSNPPTSALSVTITATSVTDTTKTSSATITVPAVTISVSPATATVLAGNTQQFTATVTNTTNTGVTWTVTCSAAQCGTLSSTTTNPVTYTAPAPPASNLAVTITAKSAADATKTSSATITVPAVTVAVAPSTANVPVKGTQAFTATVSNDAGNKGVTWTLTQGGTACSPGCGAITAATASGAPATYTAPTTVPANATVTITATSVADLTKTAAATATILGITVSVSPTSTSVVVNATQQFIATVANDVASGGVTWTLTQGGTACAPTCGTVAPTTTASGTATTYTAPATVPSTPTVTLTATSVSDASKFASATITITAAPPVSLSSISPTNPTVTINATQSFNVTVTNDPAAKGVTWTLTQSGVPCSPACGTVSPASSTGNTPSTTYTAPATVPTPATVTITATSVADTTQSASATITVSAVPPCGTGSEAKLNGQYAFQLQGFDLNGPVGVAGSFTADGTGKITAGQEDVNRNVASGVSNTVITTAGSSYSVGADNRGCLTLVTGTTTSSYRFSLGAFSGAPSVAAKGHVVSFDATGTNVVGVFEKQDPAAFSAAAFSGSFTFGASAPTLMAGVAGRFAVAGTFNASAGNITAVEVDTDDNGKPMHIPSFTGTYTVAGTGRGTLTLNPPGTTVQASLYVVSANEALIMSIDPQVGVNADSLFAGSVLKQSGGPFGISSLNGTNIINIDGLSGTGSDIQVGFLVPAGNGSFTLSTDENKAGAITTNSLSGTYSVAGNGRVTVTGGTNPPVIYLVSANKGFLVGTDAAVVSGSFEPQAAGPFNNASFSGSYSFGDVAPVVNSSSLESGVATPDGINTINGTSDNNQSGTLVGGQTFTNSYAVSSTGRTTVGTNNVLYIVSTSKAYLMSIKPASSSGRTDPTITVVEK